MSKYRFHLETLRKLRVSHRDQMRARLAEAYQAEDVLAEQRMKVEAELADIKRDRGRVHVGEYMDVERLIASQRYELVLRSQSRSLVEKEALLQAETEKRRQAVVQADREVKSLNLLDDRRRAAYVRSQERQQAKELDEIAIRQTRKHTQKMP
jgi:flagellar export protein FliJ